MLVSVLFRRHCTVYGMKAVIAPPVITLIMDAALRSAYYLIAGTNPDPEAFTAVRGMFSFYIWYFPNI